MGLFDDLPSAKPSGLFDDLPTVQPTTNPTPALPAAPVAPSLADMVAPQIAPTAPAPALPVEQPTPAPMGVAGLFADLPQSQPATAPVEVAPAPVVDPLVTALQQQLQTAPATMRPQIEARLAEIEAQLAAEQAPQEPAVPLADLGKRTARGFTEVGAALPEAAGIAAAAGADARVEDTRGGLDNRQQQITDIQQRLQSTDLTDEERAFRTQQLADLQEGQATVQDNLAVTEERAALPAQEREIFLAGDKIRQASQELFGTPDPQFDDRFIGKLAEGAGSLAGFVGVTLLTGVGGGAVAGSGLNASQMFNRAIQGGATEEEARTAAFLGSIIGASEVVPIGRALDLLPSAMRERVAGAIGQRMANAFATAGEEGAQEAAVGIANNLIERGIFNPERGVFEDVGEEALIGAILGGGLGAVAPTRRVATTEPPSTETAAPQQPQLGDDDERTGIEPVAPVGGSDAEGGGGDPTVPALRGRVAPERPARPDAPQDPPVVGGTGEPTGNLTPVVEQEPTVSEPQAALPVTEQGSENVPQDQPAQPSPTAEVPAPNARGPISREVLPRAPVVPRSERAERLSTFVVRAGGIFQGDDQGDIAALEARRPGLLKRERFRASTAGDNGGGLTVDDMRERAVEAGFLEPDADINTFIDALAQDVNPNLPNVFARGEDNAAVDEAERGRVEFDRAVNDGRIPADPFEDGNFTVTPDSIAFSPDPRRFVEQGVDEFVRRNPVDLSPEERETVVRRLVENGGDADSAIERVLIQAAETESPRIANDPELQEIPFGEVDQPDRRGAEIGPAEQGTAREPDQDAGQGEATSGEPEEAFGTEQTDAGEQAVIPGTETEQTGEAQRAQAEAQARQQQSRIRRGDQTRIEDDDDSLFGGGQESLLDAGDTTPRRNTTTARDAAPARTRPGGRLSPTFMEFAYTNRPSVFDHAFRAAGVDPDDARLMPIEEQIRIVKRAVTSTFGIQVELPTITVQRKNLAGRKVTDQRRSLQSRKVLDQLLNGYRQLQMLAHLMGMPEKAVGLPIDGQPLTLSLVKGKHLRGALGMFSWGGGKRTISLADMSNSFAHEWGHALDHYLMVQADRPSLKGMLSREMNHKGVIPPLSPKRALTDAFAHVMWSMMGRASGAGEITIRLQVESAQLGPDGKPTPKAKRAQKILTDIREGRPPPKEYWSDYFKTSKAFDEQVQADGYFEDPAEMFARAFEAMIAHQVSQITDQPQAFLSKGDFSGTSDARLNLTFPKDVDLAQFTLAMGNLKHAMARVNLHGKDAPALAPETHDVQTTRDLLKDQKGNPLSVLSQREVSEWGRALDMMRDLPNGAKRTKDSITSGVSAFYSQALRTTAATMYATADRQTNPKAKEAFTNIAKAVGKRPGSGQLTENVWEEKVRRRAAVYINKIDGAMRKAVSGPLRRLSQQDMRDVRALLANDKISTKPEIRRLAVDLRKILDDIWFDLDSAGVELGYASGFLPHRYDPQKASENPDKFRAQAAKVYDMMFQREIVDNEDADSQLSDINAIVRGLRGAMQATTEGEATPRSRLSPDDEGLVETFRKERKRLKDLERQQKKSDDPDKFEDKIAEQVEVVDSAKGEMLEMLQDRWSAYSAEKWLNKIRTGNLDDYGSIGPTASFLKARKLPNEAGSIMREFMEENPIQMITSYAFDAARRSEYSKVFGPNNEKLENMLLAAEGATREDVELMKQAVAASTGRVNRVMSGMGHFKTSVFSLGTMNMLTMATFSSLAEPLSVGLRSGQVRDSFRAMAEFVVNLVAKGRRRDLQELARTIGLIMPYAQDTLMQNRMGMDVLNNRHFLNETVGRFFVLNGLTPLTHYQRTVMLPVANAVILRHLRASVEGKRGLYGRVRDTIDGKERGFSDSELNELGIPQEDRADLLKWIDETGGMPSPQDLFGPDGEMHKAAELWARATHRFTTETIQDTLKSDRAMLANDPNHAAMYGIMSFIDAFTRNIIFRTLERGMKEGDGTAKKGAKMTANLAIAAAPAMTLFMGQILAGVIREALINREELEKQIEEDTALEWLVWRGFDRTGFTGRLQPFVNLMTGLRYETDLTTMFAGPYVAYFLGNMQRTLKAAAGRNSPNTNTSEFTSAEGIYRLFVKVPATTLIAAGAPAGPVSSNLGRAAIMWLSGKGTEDAFAEALVGEKGSKHVGDPPWWELGD